MKSTRPLQSILFTSGYLERKACVGVGKRRFKAEGRALEKNSELESTCDDGRRFFSRFASRRYFDDNFVFALIMKWHTCWRACNYSDGVKTGKISFTGISCARTSVISSKANFLFLGSCKRYLLYGSIVK